MAEIRPDRQLETERSLQQLRASEQNFRLVAASLESQVNHLNHQLQTCTEEFESFCYSVSHDLRAPLRHIRGFIDLLNQTAGPALSSTDRNYLEIVTESANRMSQSLDDLLLFSRMGRVEMQLVPVNLRLLAEEIIGRLNKDTARRNIVWRVGDLPEVVVDLPMIRRMLGNLLSNAVKYTSPRPRAEIDVGLAEDTPEKVVIFVRDNGVGFDPKSANKLFGVFQRLHPASDFEGTGVGLAIVRRIITRHGGRVWAEGKPDEGATFHVLLPKLAMNTTECAQTAPRHLPNP